MVVKVWYGRKRVVWWEKCGMVGKVWYGGKNVV